MTQRKRRSIILLLILLLIYIPIAFIVTNIIKEYSRFETYNVFGYDTQNPLTAIIKAVTDKDNHDDMSTGETVKTQINNLRTLLYEGYMESFSQAVNLLTVSDVQSISPLDTYYIYIDEYSYSQLTSDLPHSGFEEVEGYLKYNDGTMQNVDLRFRGDNTWHWYFTQKSWRVKTKKTELLNGARKINLINPSEISAMIDYLSFLLGDKMGVLSTDAQPVRVFVNNNYMGVAIDMAQTDEYFIRNHDMLPSELYVGDHIWIDEENKNLGYMGVNLWETESIFVWEKMAENNNIASDDFSPLYNLIDFVERNQEDEFSYEIEKYIDIDKYLNWRACMNIVGSVHANNNHNQKLYFDPSSGKIEPVLWDTDGFVYSSYQRSLSWAISDLDKVILKNPEYADRMYGIIYDTANEYITKYDMLDMVDDAYELMRQDIYADLYKDYLVETTFSRDYTNGDFDVAYLDMKEWIANRYDFINGTLSATEIKYDFKKSDEGYTLLNVEIDGVSGVRIEAVELGCAVDETLEIYRDINLNGILDDADELVGFSIYQNSIMLMNEKIYPALLDMKFTQMGSVFNPEAEAVSSPEYTYILTGDVNIENIYAINTVTNQNAECTKTDEVAFAHASLYTTHPWSVGRDIEDENVVFDAGIYIIDEDIIINRNSKITINEGAVLKMKKDVSIYVFGKLEIKGTYDNPVVIQALDQNEPWGVLAMQGHYSPEVTHEIDYGNISGGGVPANYDNAMYTGMVSAYNTKLILTNSQISGNLVGDDGLNVKQGEVMVDRCMFTNAFSDAVDLDYVQGTIQNSYFADSGNDAIDLMTTSIEIKNNYIINSGDKGISIGEKSNPVITNNIIENCNIGIEIKDLSDPVIANNVIANCKTGINAYHKNDKYESGGQGQVESCIIIDSIDNAITVDNESMLIAKNTLLDEVIESNNNLSVIDCAYIGAEGIDYYLVQSGRYAGFGLISPIEMWWE